MGLLSIRWVHYMAISTNREAPESPDLHPIALREGFGHRGKEG